MEKSPDAFRTISEAAEELGLPQHVLRFWETRFSTIKPLKRGGGRRYYRPEDVLLLKGIRHLLYDQGFTIKGVQRILKDQGQRYVVGIGEGGPVGALARQSGDDDEPEEIVGAGSKYSDVRDDDLVPAPAPRDPKTLDAADRQKLADVLRELLDCKRLLERAREG
jgi:DNA-binding transcriptional MerR regulator